MHACLPVDDPAVLAWGGTVVLLPTGDYATVHQFMFTWAILSDLCAWGYGDRWCYKSEAGAWLALNEWNGQGDPEGWHRHPDSGRRREYTPTGFQEYVAP